MPIKTILLDAFGTVIFPKHSIAQIYCDVATEVGLTTQVSEIQQRFPQAFQHIFRPWRDIVFTDPTLEQWQEDWIQNPAATIQQWPYNECLLEAVPKCNQSGDRYKWRQLIGQVFPEAASNEIDILFEKLWDKFSEPDVWRIDETWTQLSLWAKNNGVKIALASNFDSRLRKIVAGIPALSELDQLFISTEIGESKPSPRFYVSILLELGHDANDVMMVGDSWCEDVAVPRSIGLHSLWVQKQSTNHPLIIQNLGQIPERVPS